MDTDCKFTESSFCRRRASAVQRLLHNKSFSRPLFNEDSPFWGRSSLKCFTTPLGFEHLRSELHRETLFRRKVHHGRLPCGSFLKSLASVYTSIVWCYSIAENMTPSVCFKPTLQLFYCLNLILRDEMQQGLSTSRRHSSQSSMLRDESENGTILNIFGGFWKKK